MRILFNIIVDLVCLYGGSWLINVIYNNAMFEPAYPKGILPLWVVAPTATLVFFIAMGIGIIVWKPWKWGN